MATTYQEFADKLDRLDAEFAKKMEDQNKKFFADKPDDSTLSPEMKEHYDKFEKMIKEHTDKFTKRCATIPSTSSKSSRSCWSSRRMRSSPPSKAPAAAATLCVTPTRCPLRGIVHHPPSLPSLTIFYFG
eukprot:TRINITY_DN310_c0_g1_i2.p1 TRINITY_DN310_c0_g1~~TRINITY_DN310_c0_g1_i2.p1  ORF type:complete len:140 (+),score=33.74 TRINITY_DN310_c0_g1_i2:32-421(+)